MTTITIYKLHSGLTNVADTYSLHAWTMREEEGDHPVKVDLPGGFSLSDDNAMASLEIYDAAGGHWELTSDGDGAPAIAGSKGMIRLVEVAG